MDKSFLVFLAIGLAFLYFITHFVGGIQEEDERFRNNTYEQEHKYDTYKGMDSVGRAVLNVEGVDTATQIGAWNEGSLKEEFLDLYPDFSLMKDFIKNRVHGEPIKSRLLKHVDDVETKFFAGELTTEQAKAALASFK
ncbi:hypothetical protein YH65_10830 [Sulfurovum lithotrophicum]|uniref:Uncharacterized protein n=1 Tax=Sulfurovum lithotrophicum TaxID=206403 RepID=A0A7U4M2S9_9BACT|nr:hypothetical protein [Sulfurovum lithotrophicum]AKF25824.1 hypothetical protein YH65_10830 [Sulfurovum lithotrophicum]